ncbi:MAG: EAL domain-containing protein [Alphaproteobacteria bacterium]
MSRPLSALFVGNVENDALLLVSHLRQGDFDPRIERVQAEPAMRSALERGGWDVVFCDMEFQDFDVHAALRLLRECHADIPLIVVTDAIGEKHAVGVMHEGAADIVLKKNLVRLVPAITRELAAANERRKRRASEETLAERDRQLRSLATNFPGMIYRRIRKPDGTFAIPFAAGMLLEELGLPSDAGFDYLPALRPMTHPDDREFVHRAIRESADALAPLAFEFRYVTPAGKVGWLSTSSTPSRRDGGDVVWDAIAVDITERKETQAALQRSEERLHSVADSLPGIVFQRLRKTGGTIAYTYVSSRAQEFFGTGSDDLREFGRKVAQFMHPDDRSAYIAAMEQSASELGAMVAESRFTRPGGDACWLRSMSRPRRLENGDIQWDGVKLDISELKRLEAARHNLAYYDQLTGLPNQVLFVDRVSQALIHASRSRAKVAVICAELEAVGDIRDSRGFAVADTVIRHAAARIATTLRPGDTVAHHSDGHFLAALNPIQNARDAMIPVRRLVQAFDEPFAVSGSELFARMRVGISLYPDDADRPEELLQHATMALSRAKSLVEQRYEFYNTHMTAAAEARVKIEVELRRAIERGEIEVFYQPQVDPIDFRITGMEALARWRHPARGIVPPGEFIPIAEQTGLIAPLGEHVLRMACAQTAAWEREGLCAFPVSVNVSGWQLMHAELGDRFLAILAESGLAPSHLRLELTESTIVRNLSTAARTMEKLAAAGVSFAIDDFGIEHSALSHLSQLPIEVLKVDHTFVARMTTNTAHAALVQAIVTMAHGMQKKAIAEGVETEEELVYLRAYQCDALQGFLFSKPVPPDVCAGLLRAKTLPPGSGGPPKGRPA